MSPYDETMLKWVYHIQIIDEYIRLYKISSLSRGEASPYK